MKKLSQLLAIAFTIMAIFLTTSVKAQTTPAKGWVFSFGADAGVPTGPLKISSNLVLGGTPRFQYGITNNLAFTFTSGADHFLSKDIPGTNIKYDSYGVIPVKAGLKEFFVPNIYVGAEAGVAFEEVDTRDKPGHDKFLFSPAVGWANSRWDVGVRYDSYSGQNDNYGVVALRVAYGFAL
jgi:hypothetical protein